MEFYLRGNSIPTDGSGRLLITDIGLHNEQQSSTSDEDALICRSSKDVAKLHTSKNASDWYLDELVNTTTNLVTGVRIAGDNDRGWTRNRDRVEVTHRVVRLKRVSETPSEGKFTCHFKNDEHNNRSLLILYPSKSLSECQD